MRFLPAVLVIALIWVLSHPLGSLPALGTMLDPVNGIMAAAEPVDKDFNSNLQLSGVQARVEVWLEDRLVPHIRAQNDHDLYFTQGYVHAYFRLWQMDMQTRAAGGRVSEVAGEKALEFDRGQRRKGMVFGAEKSLAAMEADPRTRDMLNAYRDGINTYIATLNFRELPIEYKLMGFEPEKWTNLRSALLLKYMADDLTGKTDDIAFTLLRDQLGEEQFNYLFPERIPGSKPVIPEGTKFDLPSLKTPPVPAGDVWAHFGDASTKRATGGVIGNKQLAIRNGAGAGAGGILQLAVCSPASRVNASRTVPTNIIQPYPTSSNFIQQPPGDPDVAVGSNNWAISGTHTASGKPILCNDPHLGLNLPSLWFEIQLTAPGINTYGVSLPGAPGVVIGYNEKISWGFTNNYRDVKDFYEISAIDASKTAYYFGNGQRSFERKVERIGIKGGGEKTDTVLYTLHGPVMHDPSFPDPAKTGKLLACTWMAHRGTNELLSLYLVNRAGDYERFTQAIQHFECPAQNFVYADISGNIAMWGQGRFINKWKGQGRFVMNGADTGTLWGDTIPMAENPHVLNPPQGYVASANQQVTDSTYPYWYNGNFTEWRSWEINALLADANAHEDKKYSTDDAGTMQNWTASRLWNDVLDLASNYGMVVPQPFKPHMYPAFLAADRVHATQFQLWWSRFYEDVWRGKLPQKGVRFPSSERTIQLMRADSMSSYFDIAATPQREGLRERVQEAMYETMDSLNALKKNGGIEWYQVKNTSLTHLAKLPAFSYDHLKIGGWGNTINAVSGNHGPSWRMIVEMDSIPKARAIYPGGQSGNPGSRHYGDNVQQWVDGKYNELRFLTGAMTKNPFRYTWKISA